MRNGENNFNRDAKWFLFIQNKEMTQINKKNTNFSRKNGQGILAVSKEGINNGIDHLFLSNLTLTCHCLTQLFLDHM